MNDSVKEINLDELLADSIAKDAVPDFSRMSLLEERLAAAFKDYKTQGDGGLVGALNSIKAYFDYFADRRPEWAKTGLLNPLAEIIETLRALKDGGTSQILTANSHRINRQRLTLGERTARGSISALVDVVMTKRPCSEDEACGVIARALRLRQMPLGRGLDWSKDATTVKNWRKTASTGRVGVDPDATIYACMKERLLARPGPINVIIDEVLDGIFGIRPPSPKS